MQHTMLPGVSGGEICPSALRLRILPVLGDNTGVQRSSNTSSILRLNGINKTRINSESNTRQP